MSGSQPRAARIAALIALGVAAAGVGAAFFVWQHRSAGVRSGASNPDLAGGPRSQTPSSLFAVDPYFDPSEPLATVEGLVVGGDVLPLDGATVALIRISRRHQTAPPGNGTADPIIDVAQTSGSGRFRFEQVIAGAYLVAAMAEGRAPISLGPITLAPGETKSQTIRLSQSGGITLAGRIFTSVEAAASGAKVRVVQWLPGREHTAGFARVFQTVTDEAGAYQMHLAPGTYVVSADADGHPPARSWLTLTRDQTLDLHLPPAARVLGTVIQRGSKQPIPDADLWLLPLHPNLGLGASDRPRDVHADRIGRFAFNQLPAGTYRIGARKDRLAGLSAPVSLAAGQTATDVVVELAPAQAIAGRVVTTTGAPVPNARLELVKAQPPFERALFVKTEWDGRFLLEGIQPELFHLGVTADGLARSTHELRVTRDIPSLEIRLHREASVRGRVSTADRRPADGTSVTLRIAPSTSTSTSASGAATVRERTTTGADGAFEIRGLSAGDLTLRAQHPTYGLAVSKAQKLAEGERKSLSLILDAGSAITGVVKFDAGGPAAGLVVQAAEIGGGAANLWTDVTAVDGSFKLTGLPAGNFNIGAVGRGPTRTLAVDGRTVKAGVNLVATTGAAISGVTLAPDGRPLAGAEITVSPQGSAPARRDSAEAARSISGPDGAFSVSPTAPGKQALWATHPGFPAARTEGIDAGDTQVRLQFPPGATIAGTVLGPDGKPVTHYTIVLGAPRSAPGPDRPADAPLDTIHDASGRFFFSHVAAGAHELRATSVTGGTAALTITLAAGEKKTGVRLVIPH